METTTSSSTQVLFGDLIAAVEQTIDNEGAVGLQYVSPGESVASRTRSKKSA